MKNEAPRSCLRIAKNLLPLLLAVIFSISNAYAQRAPIDVNLIIDGSSSFSGVKEEVASWINNRLGQILVDGDRVTVWSAGSSARVIYTGRVEASTRDAVNRSIRDIEPSGNNPDFSSALREAAGRQSSGFSYTLLISASPQALSSVINNPQGNLLRFSRVEDFSSWRALVVGLNLDSRVRRATSAYFD